MDKPGEGRFNPNNEENHSIEESSDEDEQGPHTNDQATPSNDAASSDQGAIDNNELHAGQPNRHEIPTNNFWCYYWFIWNALNFVVGFCWYWLLSILDFIGILTIGSPIEISNNEQGATCRESRSYHTNNHGFYQNIFTGNVFVQLLNILIYIVIFLVLTLMLIHTPFGPNNASSRFTIMSDNVKSIPQDNSNSDINENATLYDNRINDITDSIIPDNPNTQALVTGSIGVEAIDDLTGGVHPTDSIAIKDAILINFNIDQESEISNMSDNGFEADDELETTSGSGDYHDPTSDNDSSSTDHDSLLSEISFLMNDEGNENDSNDQMSIITHITCDTTSEDSSNTDNDTSSADTDSGHFSEINSNVDSEDNSIYDNQERSSDNGYDSNGEDSLISNDGDNERDIMSDINDELNNENDEIDDNDKMSIITHLTYATSSEGDSVSDHDQISISTDSGLCFDMDYHVDSEDDSFDGNNEPSSISDSGCEGNDQETSMNDKNYENSVIFYTNDEINNENDDSDKMSIITHITYDPTSEGDSMSDNDQISISTDGGYHTKDENDSVTDNDEESDLIENPDNALLDEEISTTAPSTLPTSVIGSLFDPLLIIETDADALNNVDHETGALCSNTNVINSIEQSISIILNEKLQTERASLETTDNPTCNINPLVSTQTQDDMPSNSISDQTEQQTHISENILCTSRENDQAVTNQNTPDLVLLSVTQTNLANVPTNTLTHQILSINEQAATQISPLVLDQTLEVEEKAVDQKETASLNRPNNKASHKITSTINDQDEIPSKQDIE